MSPKARADQFARRINAAVELLSSGLSVPEASRRLGRRHQISERQARRYVERARDEGRLNIPEPKVVFTVKVPVGLVRRVRSYARTSQETLSAVVSRALEELLGRMRVGSGPGCSISWHASAARRGSTPGR